MRAALSAISTGTQSAYKGKGLFCGLDGFLLSIYTYSITGKTIHMTLSLGVHVLANVYIHRLIEIIHIHIYVF
jgi:hypothetical protein